MSWVVTGQHANMEEANNNLLKSNLDGGWYN